MLLLIWCVIVCSVLCCVGHALVPGSRRVLLPVSVFLLLVLVCVLLVLLLLLLVVVLLLLAPRLFTSTCKVISTSVIIITRELEGVGDVLVPFVY